MKFAITGASGLVGAALRRELESTGHAVTPVVRDRARARRGAAYWNPDAVEMDERGFEGHDVVVHLAGESLFGLWTRARKERIRRSRVQGTQLLASGLAGLARPPALLISASAIGFYGNRPADVVLTEEDPGAQGFLPGVVRQWEAATEPAAQAGIRSVQLRFGLVLAREGGIVHKMLPPFRLGLGAIVGPGDQAWSWIALADIPRVVHHVVQHAELAGPVNTTAPQTVSAEEFSRTLGRVLHRPVPIRVPRAVVALAPGGMGRELALASANVAPARLVATGFEFRYPALEPALRDLLQPA